jgi:hypothetical protein
MMTRLPFGTCYTSTSLHYGKLMKSRQKQTECFTVSLGKPVHDAAITQLLSKCFRQAHQQAFWKVVSSLADSLCSSQQGEVVCDCNAMQAVLLSCRRLQQHHAYVD